MRWRGSGKPGVDAKYFILSPPYTICRITLGGVNWYELWKDGVFVARFKTAAEAKEFVSGIDEQKKG